jgi:glutamate--cysteine ligase
VLTRIRAKYKEYGITDAPFVIVKADAGTYGMGIMTVRDASEVRDLNRKQRNKMAVVKEGLQVSDVIIQEGVATRETVEDAVAEPVVYMIDRYVVGGFYRVNKERGIDENLNAPGMHFVPLAFASSCNLPDCNAPADARPTASTATAWWRGWRWRPRRSSSIAPRTCCRHRSPPARRRSLRSPRSAEHRAWRRACRCCSSSIRSTI